MKKPGNAGGAKARQEGGCVESMTKQEELSKVEETPKQGREAESQKWSWVEAEVWTERMLTTLETGVKGGENAYFIEQGDQRQIEFPQRRLEIPTQGLKKKSCSRPLRRPFPRSSFL